MATSARAWISPRNMGRRINSSGSCVTNVRFRVPAAHSLDQMRRDLFCIQHRFIRRHIAMQVLFVDASEGSQIGPERCTCSFTGVAVDLASAIPIVIASPFMHPVADSGMGRMAATIALPFVGVEYRATNWDVRRDQVVTGAFGRMVTDPEAGLARVSGDDADDGRPIVGVGPVALPLVGMPPGRIRGVRVRRALFLPRAGTVRLPQRRCRSSRGCHSPHRPGSGMPESGLGRGRGVVYRCHSAGMSTPEGGGAVPTRGCRYYRPSARRSENQSCRDDSTPRTGAIHEPFIMILH
jgi:hypothetical protein